jgi:hypothetical protein
MERGFRWRSQTMIMPKMNVDEAVSIRWLNRTLAKGRRP